MAGIQLILAVHAAIIVLCAVGAVVLLRRHHRVGAVVTLVAIPIAMTGWYFLSAQPAIGAVLYRSDTVFASGYSSETFQEVRVGEAASTVRQKLGEPLAVRKSDDELWMHYSRAGRSKNYWNKIIVIDTKTERVVRIVDDFYAD